MNRWKLFALLLALLPLSIALAQPAAEKPMQVGIAKSFFNDLPQVFIDIAIAPFTPLMKKMTGQDGKLITADTASEMGQKLNNGQLQIGVFYGFEFAWAQKQNPGLEPLLVAVNKHRDVRTFVIVHKNDPAKDLKDLRGKTVAVALGTKEHSRVYLDRRCADNNQSTAATFFGKIERSKSYEDALDDISRNKVDAVVVDTIALEFYKDIKLPFFTRWMRVLETSRPFPEAVIAYKKGGVDDKTLAKFKTGLLNAKDDPNGLDMMKMLNIHAFEAPPKDFAATINNFLKEFPAPEPTKVGLR